ALHQEAHLVQVPGEHHLRALGIAWLLADEAPEPVAADLAHALHVLLHDLRDLVLEAGDAVRFDELFEEFQRAVHRRTISPCRAFVRCAGGSVVASARSRVRRWRRRAPGRACAPPTGRTRPPWPVPPSAPGSWASSRAGCSPRAPRARRP